MSAEANQSYGMGVSLVLIATLGWSVSGLFVRLLPGLDGWQINCWRGFWTSITILCYLVLVYGGETREIFRRVPLTALILAAGFFAFGSTMYVTSLTLVSTAVISVIGATSPLFTGLFSPWMTGERPGLVSWVAAALALLGMGIIAWSGLQAGNAVGILVSLMVPFCFAMQTLTLRRFRHVDMVPAICVGGLVAFLAPMILGLILGGGMMALGPQAANVMPVALRPETLFGAYGVSLGQVSMLALMALVQLAVPLIFFARGAKSVPAVTLSLIAMLDAVLNPLWPWLAVSETPESSTFIGGAVIIGAVLLSIFGSSLRSRAGD